MKTFICLFICLSSQVFLAQALPFTQRIEGTVVDELSKKPIDNAEVELHCHTDMTKMTYMTDEKGKFIFSLQPNRMYSLKIRHLQYFASIKNINTSEITYDILDFFPLKMIILGKSSHLENVGFALNADSLLSESEAALHQLYDLLVNNPRLLIEIGAHTDSRGDDTYNLELTQKQAEKVLQWFLSQGIPERQMKPKGYGETMLLNHCSNGVKCSTREHLQNRRLEYTILGFLASD